MKRPNADEISRWLMDDTLVMEGRDSKHAAWTLTHHGVWEEIRVSIANVEGKPLFDKDTYYNEYGQERTAHIGLTDSWDKCTLTPPKPKSILDSEELHNLLVDMVRPSRGIAGGFTINSAELKQFIRDHKDEI